jgi:hypothetical protein
MQVIATPPESKSFVVKLLRPMNAFTAEKVVEGHEIAGREKVVVADVGATVTS